MPTINPLHLTRSQLLSSLSLFLPLTLWLFILLGLQSGQIERLFRPDNPVLVFHRIRAVLPLLAGFVAVVIIAYRIYRRGSGRRFFFGPLGFATAYGLVGLAASFVSPDSSVALYWAAAYLSVPLALWGIVWGRDWPAAIRIVVNLNWLIIILAVLLLFGVALLYMDLAEQLLNPAELLQCQGSQWFTLTSSRLRETGVGRYAAIAGIIAIGGLWQARWRTMWIVILLASLTLLLSTTARGAYVGFAVGAALILLIFLLHAGKRALLVTTAVTAIVVALGWSTGSAEVFLYKCLFRTPGYVQSSDSGGYNDRGVEFHRQGQYDLAIVDFDHSISLDPDTVQTFVNRGLAYIGLGQYQRAIEDFDVAINRRQGYFYPGTPEYFSYFYGRGLAHFNLGNYPKALKDFDRAINGFDHPDVAEAHLLRGVVYGLLGRTDLALDDLGEIVVAIDDINLGQRLNPQLSRVYYSRGLAHFYLGNYLQAISYFDEAIRRDPQDDSANSGRNLAITKLALGHGPEDAVDLLQAEKPPEEPAAQPASPVVPATPEAPPEEHVTLNRTAVEKPTDSEETGLITKEFFKFTGRTAVWAAGLKLFKDSPMIGLGFHADRLLLGTHMHNSVMQALIQSGLIGVILFVAAMAFGWVLLFRSVLKLALLSKSDQILVVQCGGVLAFLTMRSFPESTGAFFGVDWLILAPILLYLQVMNSRRTSLNEQETENRMSGGV